MLNEKVKLFQRILKTNRVNDGKKKTVTGDISITKEIYPND